MEEYRTATDISVAVDAEMAAGEIIQPTKQPRKRFIGRRAAAQRAEKNGEKAGNSSSTIGDTGTVQGIYKVFRKFREHTSEYLNLVSKPRRTARTLNSVPAS